MERAAVRIVTEGDGDNTGGAAPVAPTAPPSSSQPEAQPGVIGAQVAPPPQELEHDLGGPTLPNPTPEELVQAAGGSVADRLRARFESMAATEEFAVPGWELPSGEPGLLIEARTFGDRKAFNAGVSNEAFIARSTHKLWLVNDDGTREEITGGWGPQLAAMIGHPGIQKAADLVAMVISKPDPNNPGVRIPNVPGIGALATELVLWSRKGQKDVEETLGE
jgi:hypothetical protein